MLAQGLERGRRGEEYLDDSFVVLFNAHHEPITYALPVAKWGDTWLVVADTRSAAFEIEETTLKAGDALDVEARSVVVLRRGS